VEDALLGRVLNQVQQTGIPPAFAELCRAGQRLGLRRTGERRRTELRDQPKGAIVIGARRPAAAALVTDDHDVCCDSIAHARDDGAPGLVSHVFPGVGARRQVRAHRGINAVGAHQQVAAFEAPILEGRGHV